MNFINNLSGKNILVTGASSGIGRETCKVLSGYGAKIIMVARRQNILEEVKKELEGEGHTYYDYDLSNISGIEPLIKQIVNENGKLDGFVHCAGLGPTRPLNLTDYNFLHNVMLINFYAFVEISRIYAKKKNNNGGSIVAISSVAGIRGDSAKTSYCASKAAVDGAVRSMAVELRTKGIRVNSIQPGWVHTEMYDAYIRENGEHAETRFKANPKNIMVEPTEIANEVAFLLSNAASAISGASIISNSIGL